MSATIAYTPDLPRDRPSTIQISRVSRRERARVARAGGSLPAEAMEDGGSAMVALYRTPPARAAAAVHRPLLTAGAVFDGRVRDCPHSSPRTWAPPLPARAARNHSRAAPTYAAPSTPFVHLERT